jgi:hypothetical protein
VAIQDFADRIRVRQGPSGSAGMWLFQNGPMADRGFVGMRDDNAVGLWGNTGARWGLIMNTTTGNVGIGIQNPGFRLDVADRVRVRQGQTGTAGMWLFQNGPMADQAFVGMRDDSTVGLWGNTGAGWGLVMETGTPRVKIGPQSTNWGAALAIGATGHDSGLVVENNTTNIFTMTANNLGGGPVGWFKGFVSFDGDVTIKGRLSNPLSQFKIDHPLDPANQYLSHSVMESDEMKNVYDGVVELDADGAAEVQLGNWCEAFNHRFRYQLTPIGSPAPDLHVAQELSANRFRIAGGRAGMTVCWQVTGVRQDVYAQAHPLLVEEDKPSGERGYYLYPDLYGQPADRSIEWARFPEQMRLISEGAQAARAQADSEEDQADVQSAGRK